MGEDCPKIDILIGIDNYGKILTGQRDYLTHLPVFKPDSVPTRIRPVFDVSLEEAVRSALDSLNVESISENIVPEFWELDEIEKAIPSM
ncbi:hypothetical protein TNCV_1454981 [Trichonephila clavipes]|nr:hypothetical protein TNCV_1454981 [Trichonephila clavipes]